MNTKKLTKITITSEKDVELEGGVEGLFGRTERTITIRVPESKVSYYEKLCNSGESKVNLVIEAIK